MVSNELYNHHEHCRYNNDEEDKGIQVEGEDQKR